MALHWEHIVGINGTAPTYTEIKFDDAESGIKTPKIKTGTNPNDINTDWGNIVTTSSTIPFEELQTFSKGINTQTWNIGNNRDQTATVTGGEVDYKLSKQSKWTIAEQDAFTMATNNVTSHKNFQVGGDKYCRINATTGAITTPGKITVEGTTNCVEAPYFNATSDRRAKNNIQPLTISALDWINATTIYSFNYLSNPDLTVGVVAQELHPLGDVSFVKNAAATGENGDYMAVAESKLVYVAIKAIQELSKQVEDLQNELHAYRQSK